MTFSTQLSTKAQDDFNLVQMAIAGDQRAYSELMSRYRSSVYHTILKMVNNVEDANDLTIEAFGKAFRKLHSYTPHYAFSTWLFRIAINNCIDYIRKKRINLLSIDETIEQESEQDYSSNIRACVLDPEEQFINEQKVQLMRSLLSKLNEKYRLMIELRYFEELSYEEIAIELNIPLGTVKAQLFRAKEMLYEMIQMPGASAYLETTKRKAKTRSTTPNAVMDMQMMDMPSAACAA